MDNSEPHPAFTEAGAWRSFPHGWQPLHGSFDEHGFSVEWHDFEATTDLDWAASFHPHGLEICLNLDGSGEITKGTQRLELGPNTAGFYLNGASRLKGRRRGGERHRFFTVEFSSEFLARHVRPRESGLHPCLHRLLKDRRTSGVSEASRLTSEQHELIRALQHPPASLPSRRLWSYAKSIEIATSLFYAPPADELLCQRIKRLNRERVQKVVAILKENLADPPALEEIGRRVGCSHFHLSRIFSEQAGRTIFQHLRELRLERAATLLREGELQITQIAMEVGYSSPSHFTTAFREAFGCCPGLYPRRSGSAAKEH